MASWEEVKTLTNEQVKILKSKITFDELRFYSLKELIEMAK